MQFLVVEIDIPCRLYTCLLILKWCRVNYILLHRMLFCCIKETFFPFQQFPACSSKFSSHFPELDNCPDFNDALVEALQGEPANNLPGYHHLCY